MSRPFSYVGAGCKVSDTLLEEVRQAGVKVNAGLQQLDLAGTGISEYNQRYLTQKLAKPDYEFCIVTYMLGYILSHAQGPREELTLVDYGAGSGVICMVAKALGIGKVIYCDVYDVSCRDAEVISSLLDLRADDYICGEMDEVIRYFQANRGRCDCLVSHDCLEHVYDIEGFLRLIPRLPHKSMAIWLSSAANPLRRRTRRTLERVAIDAEHKDQQSDWGHKQRDALQSFLSIRRQMVGAAAGDLSEKEVEMLAHNTRGMRDEDIREAVRRYLDDGSVPKPGHATNTCDPHTGNWAERLMNPFWLADVAKEAGLPLQVKPGFWSPQPDNKTKNLAKTLTNVCMSWLGPTALRMAPYYAICGTSTPPSR